MNNWMFNMDRIVDNNIFDSVRKLVVNDLKNKMVVDDEQLKEFENLDAYNLSLKFNIIDDYYSFLQGEIANSLVKDDSKKLLQKLKTEGKKVILVTKFNRKTIELFLVHNNIAKYFDFIFSSDDTNYNIQDIDYWNDLVSSSLIKTEESMIVTDSASDVEHVKQLGMKSKLIGVDIQNLDELI